VSDQTHYEVVGVADDATKADIRDAYRTRLAELRDQVDAKSERDRQSARDETAQLNAAWQVLSDPYQRQRYDERIGVSASRGDAAEDEAEVDDAGAAEDEDAAGDDPPARSSLRELFLGRGAGSTSGSGAGGRGRTPPSKPPGPEEPPASWPPGLRPPQTRARVTAMAFDLAIVLLLFIVIQFGGERVIGSVYPDETDRSEALADDIDRFQEQEDDANDRVDEAEADAERARQRDDSAAAAEARARRAQAQSAADGFEKKREAREDELAEVQEDLQPARFAVLAVGALAALLYLVPITAITGQTIGKRRQHVRLLYADGTPVGWRGSLVHYGLPVVASLLLFQIVGQLGALIALVGVLMWLRNPNRQGIHDRVAKTIVVDDTSIPSAEAEGANPAS